MVKKQHLEQWAEKFGAFRLPWLGVNVGFHADEDVTKLVLGSAMTTRCAPQVGDIIFCNLNILSLGGHNFPKYERNALKLGIYMIQTRVASSSSSIAVRNICQI